MSAGENLFWHLTGAGSMEGAQSDPDLSLGNYPSSTTIHSLESTVTTVQAAATRFLLIDSARSGDSSGEHVGKWLVMVTGSTAAEAARVTGFEGGRYILDRELSVNAQVGDYYRLFTKHSLFDAVSSAESAAGQIDWRIVSLKNDTGVVFDNTKFYVVILDSGNSVFNIVPQTAAGMNPSSLTLSDENDDPLTEYGGIDGGTGGWLDCPAISMPTKNSEGVPAGIVDLADATHWGLLIRRVTPANAERRRSAAIMIVAFSSRTGEDPDPLETGLVIPFDVEGPTLAVSIQHDRNVYIGGGARVTGTLTEQSTGLPVADRDVTITESGAGTMYPPDDLQTDEDGQLAGTYHAPIDPAEEGNVGTLQFQVGDGEET